MDWRRMIAKVLAGVSGTVGIYVLGMSVYVLFDIARSLFNGVHDWIFLDLSIGCFFLLVGVCLTSIGYQVIFKWSDAGLRNLSIVIALTGYVLLDTMRDSILGSGREELGQWRGIIWILQLCMAYIIYKLVRQWLGLGENPSVLARQKYTVRTKEASEG